MAGSLDKFSALPAAQKFVLLIVLAVGMGAAWYFVFYDDTQTAIQQAEAQSRTLQQSLKVEENRASGLKGFREEVEQLRAERDRMRAQLPDEAEVADLLEQIQGQAKITGLEMKKFQRLPMMAQDDMVARIPVQMELVGDFGQITSFFYYLSGLTRIVNVEDVKFTTIQKDPTARMQGNTLSASCVATTFMYMPNGPEALGLKRTTK